MNAPSNLPKTETRRSKPARRFNFKPVIVLALLCVGAGLLLPVVKSRSGKHHSPRGQFQADMRTMIAGVRYLFESEPAVNNNPATYASRNTGSAPRGLLEISGPSSNQVETMAMSSTNLPVPI